MNGTDQAIAALRERIAAAEADLAAQQRDYRQDLAAADDWARKESAAEQRAERLRASGNKEAERYANLARVAGAKRIQAAQEARTLEPAIAEAETRLARFRNELASLE